MNYFRVFLIANIDPRVADKYNVKAGTVTDAVDMAKDMMFRHLSLQGKCVLENDIEVLLVTDACGEKVDFIEEK